MSDVGGRFLPSYNATTAVLAASAAGYNNIVVGVAGSRIVIWHFNFITAGAVNVTLFSDTNPTSAPTALSGVYTFPTNGGYAFDSQAAGGPIVCKIGDNFIFNLSGAVGCNGFVMYSIVAGIGGG